MRHLVVGMLLLSLCGAAFAQHQGQPWSLGGFGSILYPGTGHAPTATPPLGTFRNGNGFGRGVLSTPSFANHPEHRRTVIVPYPVYYGGYGYGYDPSQGYQPGYGDQGLVNSNGAPSVVINQNFVPPQAYPQVRDYAPSDTSQDQQQSGMKLYQTPPSRPYADTAQNAAAAPARRTANDDQPTLYLIAFKDHSIVQALGFWMEGSTLHYVSAEHSLNQVSSDLIDRELSQRLNDERGVEFKLPQAR